LVRADGCVRNHQRRNGRCDQQPQEGIDHMATDTKTAGEHPHEAELAAEHEQRMKDDPEYRAEHDAAEPGGTVVDMLLEAGLNDAQAREAIA
jgi:hypothetical protein